MHNRIRILIAGSDAELGELVSSLLENHDEFEIVDFVVGSSNAAERIASWKPDIALIVAGNDHGFGQLLTSVAREAPHTRIVVVDFNGSEHDGSSSHPERDPNHVGTRYRLGTMLQLIHSKRRCVSLWDGEPSLDEPVIRLSLADRSMEPMKLLSLTGRELSVLELLASGLGNRQIADRLNLSLHTVKNHVHNVLRKLGSRNRAQIVGDLSQRSFAGRILEWEDSFEGQRNLKKNPLEK